MTAKQGDVVGALIREKREGKRLSLDDLVLRMGGLCSKSLLSQIETNRYPRKDGSAMRLSLERVDALADALGESRNEIRSLFDYPEQQDESNSDRVLEEFTYAIARYRRLPDQYRDYFTREVNQVLDFLLDVSQSVEIDDQKSPDTEPDGSPRKQTVNFMDTTELPEMSLDDLKQLGRSDEQQKKKKGRK